MTGETISDFERHRKEAIITCPESCWCWDFETKLIRAEQIAHYLRKLKSISEA